MSNNTEAVNTSVHEALEKIVVPGAEPPVREITPEAVAESLTAQLVDPAKAQQQKVSEPITEPIFPGVHPEQKLAFGFGSGLDPLTAGFNAAAAFFNFLSTTEGQRICHHIIDADELFVKKCTEIFGKIHDRIQKG